MTCFRARGKTRYAYDKIHTRLTDLSWQRSDLYWVLSEMPSGKLQEFDQCDQFVSGLRSDDRHTTVRGAFAGLQKGSGAGVKVTIQFLLCIL